MTNAEAEKYIRYLDNLRSSGMTNMFGAAPILELQFGMPIKDARKILSQWMRVSLHLPMKQRIAAFCDQSDI